MKPLGARDPFKVGLVSIGVGLLVAALIGVASVASFGTSRYTAVLEHTAGLRAGEDVQVSGVSVGEVTKVRLEDGRIRVDFVLDDDIDLGNQTRAAVKVATLLGTHYLEIVPRGGGSLEGGTIPVDQTTVPFNLQDVLEQGSERLGELDPVVLAEALSEMSRTLNATQDDIAPALRGVGRLSDLIARRSEEAGQLLAAATRVSDQLSADTGNIVGLMEQTNLVVSEVTARREAIHRLLVETTRLSESLTAIVDETEQDVRPALRNLNAALQTLREQKAALDHVLEVMAPAVRYVANATGNGPWADLFLEGPVLPADDLRCQLGDCG